MMGASRGGEMADASALGADGSNPMEVQVLSPAPFGNLHIYNNYCIIIYDEIDARASST